MQSSLFVGDALLQRAKTLAEVAGFLFQERLVVLVEEFGKEVDGGSTFCDVVLKLLYL